MRTLFGPDPPEVELSSLERLAELKSTIRTNDWGVASAQSCAGDHISRLLLGLTSIEEAPVWIVDGVTRQAEIGAIKVSVERLLPVWRELCAEVGFLDLVASDHAAWASIHYDDHFPEAPYSTSVGGRWASALETTYKNLWTATQNIVDVHEDGKLWIEDLPNLIDFLEREWNLDLEPRTRGNYSFVIPCGDYVLKLFPPSENFDRELATMLAWEGNGAARIHRHDSQIGAMLIERLRPGTELTALYHEGRDEAATAIMCGVMNQLAISATPAIVDTIPTAAELAAEIHDLRRRFDGGTGPFPGQLVDAAEGLFRDLLASQGPAHLLHADLHHENILLSERGWLAIDPHGLIGEREFETYAWLNNPIGVSKNPDLKALTQRRLDQISDLTCFDRERVRSWGAACAVLSAWWTFDGHGTVSQADLEVAQVLLEG